CDASARVSPSFPTRRSSDLISGNVLSLPLRPPAVLARAAASLDILSGGRFELGLGAGAFWEGIVAMGGRRLTPGQSVQALREARSEEHTSELQSRENLVCRL